MDMQPTAAKFPAGLIQKINAINNEVELRNDAFLLKVVGEEVDVVERERGFSAALGVPDNALANPTFEFALDGLGREYLRVSHDMLFVSGFCSIPFW